MKNLSLSSVKSLVAVSIGAAGLLALVCLAQSPSAKSKASATGSLTRIHRLGFGPGDLLVEGIRDFLRERNIKDGAVLTGIGSLSECRLHWPKKPTYPPEDVFHTFKGALEITSIQGIIADGEPHLHIMLAEKGDGRAIGGHLEAGTKVLYLAEITIAEFDGPPMTRRANHYNVKMLQAK